MSLLLHAANCRQRLLLFQRLAHPIGDDRGIIVHRKRHGPLETLWTCDQDAEATRCRWGSSHPRVGAVDAIPADCILFFALFRLPPAPRATPDRASAPLDGTLRRPKLYHGGADAKARASG
jgi:hypothetical protein